MANTVTVAIISDTHDYLYPEIARLIQQCDHAIHAGDIGNADILDAMQPKSGRIIAVAGNNDHERGWPAHQRDRVKALPRVDSLALPGGLVKIEHGHVHDIQKPGHDDLRKAHPEARLIVYGHTHRKIIDDFETPWVVNPGAAGMTRTRGGASCLILTAAESVWELKSFRFEDGGVSSIAATGQVSVSAA